MKCDAEVHVGTATLFAIHTRMVSTRPNNNAGRVKTSGQPLGNAIEANRTKQTGRRSCPDWSRTLF